MGLGIFCSNPIHDLFAYQGCHSTAQNFLFWLPRISCDYPRSVQDSPQYAKLLVEKSREEKNSPYRLAVVGSMTPLTYFSKPSDACNKSVNSHENIYQSYEALWNEGVCLKITTSIGTWEIDVMRQRWISSKEVLCCFSRERRHDKLWFLEQRWYQELGIYMNIFFASFWRFFISASYAPETYSIIQALYLLCFLYETFIHGFPLCCKQTWSFLDMINITQYVHTY